MNKLFTSRFMRNLRIKDKLLFALIPFILLSYLVILYTIYAVSFQETRRIVTSQADMHLKQKIQVVDTYMEKIRMETEEFMFAQDVRNLLIIQRNSQTDEVQDQMTKEITRDMHKIIINYNRYVEGICVTNSYGETYLWKMDTRSPYNQFTDRVSLLEPAAREKEGEMYISFERLDQEVVTISRIIIDPLRLREIGLFMIDFNLDFLNAVDGSGGSPSNLSLLLFSADGRVIANPEGFSSQVVREAWEGSGRIQTGGARYSAVRQTSMVSDWVIVGLINETELYRNIYNVTFLQGALIVLSVVVVVLIIYAMAGGLSRQFQQFIRKISRTNNTRDHALIRVDSQDEFRDLAEVYNQMMRRIDNLINTVYAKEVLLKSAELKAFQAQINPHFLYNTLDCINGLVDAGKPRETKNTVSALGSIMRMSIKGDEILTVEENLKYVRQYMYIEQIRYGDKILFLTEVPGELMGYMMPKLILQPILENAVNHGVSGLLGKGMIGLYGEDGGEELVFRVKDNGVGISQEVMDRIHSYDVSREGGGHIHTDSIGLLNIQARIQLLYGAGYGIRAENLPQGGTCVTIRLPKVRKEEKGDAFAHC